MTTYRNVREHWTETKQVLIVDGVALVKQVTCCCELPAGDALVCSVKRGCRTRCRCFCHTKTPPKQP